MVSYKDRNAKDLISACSETCFGAPAERGFGRRGVEKRRIRCDTAILANGSEPQQRGLRALPKKGSRKRRAGRDA
ncbi:MAG: hypothetical protein GF363_09685 [Chitinivibrionales bacterium]|nr:hypothetical protein [Chitinivibrionales bacterium]